MKCSMKSKLVYGVGINDYEGIATELKSYKSWIHMLGRCYSLKQKSYRPTYIGCSVCDEWKYFTNFKNWFDLNYIDEYHLDKDILVEGNKVYSPDACRFVPEYINALLNSHQNARGDLPLGVSRQEPNIKSGRISISYQAKCNGIGNKKLSKTFKTIPEAVSWYSETKKRIVKEQATRAFLDNSIKSDVYLALVRREF